MTNSKKVMTRCRLPGAALLLAASMLLFSAAASAQTGGEVTLSDEVGQSGNVVTVTFAYTEEDGFSALQGEAVISDPTAFTDITFPTNCGFWPATVASCQMSGDGTRLQFAAAMGPGETLPSHTFDISFQVDTIDAAMLPVTIDLVWDTADADFTPAASTDGSITIQGDPVGECDLSISPPSHNFGTIDTGANASQAFTISNAGEADCTNLSVAVSGDAAFSLASSDCGATLGAGASCSATVGFSSAAEGSFMGSLDADADQDSAAAALSGEVVEGVEPPPTVAIPTMQPWGLALMALLMLMIGVLSVRTFRS